ncbi:MAG: haloacid dehalogenase type II [Streptosporangiales bacterium]|nr:haloacid dehalogenase type II [Streptosporangiales bacterium]
MGRMRPKESPQAVVFDVFGTLVDWYGSMSAHARRVAERAGVELDPDAFATAWRRQYHPSLQTVISQGRPWCDLDRLQAESLPSVLAEFGVTLGAEDRAELVAGWHRLDAWPGTPEALHRLRAHVPIASLSNGHVRLLLDLSRYAGLPFDTLLSAELAGTYKPDPAVYLMAARLLGLEPGQVMLVAAHPADLAAAKRTGLATGFVPRPAEWGPDTAPPSPPPEADLVGTDLDDLVIQITT